MRLEDLNGLRSDDAAREFLRCCGSTRWARAMAAGRPFGNVAAVDEAAERTFDTLAPADWLEAFAAHPRIGESSRAGRVRLRPERGAGGKRRAAAPPSESERGWGPASIGKSKAGLEAEWSAQEQASASGASDAVRQRLANRQRDYEARFGYIFIVCATGMSAGDMLVALERRLPRAPADELRIASEEQRKITHLRIQRLFAG